MNQTWNRALARGPIAWGWFVAVGVDLLLNAGLFTPVFEQAREPALLNDAVLFQRIPVAYAALGVGVAALAWVVDRLAVSTTRRGVRVGAVVGLVFAVTGVVWLWTAIEMTGLFVAAATVSLISQMAAAGAVLGAARAGVPRGRIRRLALTAVLVAVTGALVAQNALR